ncbi:hypothetical protein [uncultured Erythrobacter sp.]|uniref:hypothetical protein n=1 Tax=uncultured Erythrobacter sp. TaxID=263913 RepID=UPI002601A12A|nr:hypothetical protein [uncultured Erythrobacter sp.]
MTPTSDPARALRRVYGLNIASDLDLPELQSAAFVHDPDVVIEKGAVPEAEEADPNNMRAYVDGSPDRLWLDIPDIVRMTITDGRSIVYSRYPNVPDDELRLFLLGSGMGALLMQRGYIVVHGNAIMLQELGGAVLCVGDSGAGKSTTAIAMMQRGYPILADDVCPISAEGVVPPGMPRAKLWDDTAQQLGIDTAPLERLREGDAKFNLPLGDAHCPQGQPVKAFFWLVPEEVGSVAVTPLSGAEKFTVLRNNIYRPEYLRPLGLEVDYLQRVAHLASTTPVFRVSRPATGFDIDAVTNTILATASDIAPRHDTHELTEANP